MGKHEEGEVSRIVIPPEAIEKLARMLCEKDGFDPDIRIDMFHEKSRGEHTTRWMVGWKMYVEEAQRLWLEKLTEVSTAMLSTSETAQSECLVIGDKICLFQSQSLRTEKASKKVKTKTSTLKLGS